MGILDGKVAVVTGGSRGLGLAIARAMAAEGAAVVVASRSQSSVDDAVDQLKKMGGQAAGMTLDVSNLTQVEQLAELAVCQFGRLDIWVNNAGTAGAYGPTVDFDPKTFDCVVDTNIKGVYYGSRTAMAHFIKQGSGKLINLLGRGHEKPVPFQNAYSASKAWVQSFTLALAVETRGSGAGVFAFNPGMVLTDLLTDVQVIEGSENRLKNFPLVVRMLARPAEVPAKKVAWIASPATDGKTGEMINIFSPFSMISGLLREAFKKNSPTSSDIKITTIPRYRG
jgi:glucose 1-dehydrogenase